jgi:hypothetical protein
MHQRRVDSLVLRVLENVHTILPVSDQPSFVEGHPLAHVCRAFLFSHSRLAGASSANSSDFKIPVSYFSRSKTIFSILGCRVIST